MNFNLNISKASTIPASWYYEPEILEKEFLKIFNRTWSLVGHSAQLKNPGDSLTAKIGKEPILVLLNEENKLCGFVNICRHRAGPVAVNKTNRSFLKCGYHGWTYDFKGYVSGTPEFNGIEDFNRKECHLPAVQVQTWGPFIFAAIDPVMQFDEFIGKIPGELEYLNLDELQLFHTQDFPLEANWKVYVDNYVEGYHIPTVHPDLATELDYKQYQTIPYRWYSNQSAPSKYEQGIYDSKDKRGSHYYWLFPNLMLNVYHGIFQTNLVIPQGVDRCIVRFEWYGKNLNEDDKLIEHLRKFSDQIQEEDIRICEQVFQNLKSSFYSRGRYSVKRENGLYHFHTLVAEMLSN